VTCTGTDVLEPGGQRHGQRDVHDFLQPGIDVTKQCSIQQGTTTVNFNGTVTNTGNVPLDVTCTDDQAGPVTPSDSRWTPLSQPLRQELHGDVRPSTER
jgi:hypothetical protein